MEKAAAKAARKIAERDATIAKMEEAKKKAATIATSRMWNTRVKSAIVVKEKASRGQIATPLARMIGRQER